MLIIFFFNTTSAQSQNNQSNNNYYNWFDNIMGIENIGIFNGTLFKEKYLTKNGNHKFYLTSKFKSGTIFYNGQAYYNIKMKYDIYEDNVIIQLVNNSSYSSIQLINDKLTGFLIENHNFIKISDKKDEFYNEVINGFYETLNQNKPLTLFIKHKKSKKEHLGNVVYSQFKDDNEFIIFFNNKYYKLNSKKKIQNLLPKFEKNINNFYKINKQLFKSKKSTFMTSLVEYLNNLINSSEDLY